VEAQVASQVEPRRSDDHQPETAVASASEEPAQDADKSARRRSTVREKVSFAVEPLPAAPAAVSEPIAPSPVPAPATAAPTESESSSEAQPRRGWWSRRFGNGS
jgi:ribonuclease E